MKTERKIQNTAFAVFCLLPFAVFFCRSFSKHPSQEETSEAPLQKEIQTDFPSISFFQKKESGSHQKNKNKNKIIEKKESTAVQREPVKTIDRRPSRKGLPIISRISGSELIREVLRRRGGKTMVRTTLRGNAVVYHNKIRMQAHKIVIKNGDYGFLEGRIQIYDPQTQVRLFAERAHYDRGQESIQLTGKPYLKRVSSKKNGTLLVSCSAIQYFLREKRGLLKGGLRASHLDQNMFSDEGVYLAEKQSLFLKGEPVLFAKGVYLTGDLLSYQGREGLAEFKKDAVLHQHRHIFSSSSSVSAKNKREEEVSLELEEFVRLGGEIKKEESSPEIELELELETEKRKTAKQKPSTQKELSEKWPPQRELSILSTDHLRYWFSQKIEAQGHVLVTQKDLYLSTPYLRLSGEKLQDIHAGKGNGVYMDDRKRKMKMSAKSMEYQSKSQKLFIKEKAVLHFDKDPKKNITAGSFSGDFIERDFQKKTISAQGNVQFSQASYRAASNLAVYHEKAGIVIMEGSPIIRGAASLLEAEKILIYLGKNRILLRNRVRSTFHTLP